jgi:CheY-like chemotaxis protein
MFSDAGYRVLEAGSADAALHFFETDAEIKLLFTDVSMPGTINGADLAGQVAERWPKVGIIMTSGRPFAGDLPLGVRFHAKPYEPTGRAPGRRGNGDSARATRYNKLAR